jgi:hypothetical protein
MCGFDFFRFFFGVDVTPNANPEIAIKDNSRMTKRVRGV